MAKEMEKFTFKKEMKAVFRCIKTVSKISTILNTEILALCISNF